MAFILDHKGERIDIPVDASVYSEAKKEKKSVPQLLNSKYSKDTDAAKYGSVFSQLCASEGIITTPKDNPFGLRAPTVAEILNGTSGINAVVTNNKQTGTPYGTQSRNLFPAALIAYIEAQVAVDRTTDTVMFESMVAQKVAIGGDLFEQPVINYGGVQGPQGTNGAKAQRIAQLAETPTLLQISTADRARRLPTYGMGIEMSDQAMKSSSIDLLALTVQRYLQVEKDQRVYNFLSSLFSGDNDMVIGAVPSVAASTLDPAATGGILTHKAWMKFLARNRKKRRITHVIGDISAYLAMESRTGRPGLSAYDSRLSSIDSQVNIQNALFAQDVKFFLVDSAAEGGPVPANTIWALDASQAISMVTNTEAEYQATEAFISRRSELMVMHWSSEVFRLWGDAELTPFDSLTFN